MTQHADAIQQQFDPQAQAYLHSAVHAQGPDLAWLRDAFLPTLPAGCQALDVGCGAGHLSFALAARCAALVALDPSPAMLATVRQEAARRGLSAMQTVEGVADALPFAPASFDLVASRYSAHHWRDLPAALRELRRVLKPGGCLLMIDVAGDDDALVDSHLQAMELLRDRSHLRNRAPGEWQALLAAAGLTLQQSQAWPLRLEFASWVARMRTSPLRCQAILALQAEAPAEVRRALAIEADGSFSVRTGAWVALRGDE